jgi:hypothetical protein
MPGLTKSRSSSRWATTVTNVPALQSAACAIAGTRTAPIPINRNSSTAATIQRGLPLRMGPSKTLGLPKGRVCSESAVRSVVDATRMKAAPRTPIWKILRGWHFVPSCGDFRMPARRRIAWRADLTAVARSASVTCGKATISALEPEVSDQVPALLDVADRAIASPRGALRPRMLRGLDPPEDGPHHGGLGDPLEPHVQP